MTHRQKTTHTIELEDRTQVIRAESGPLPMYDAPPLSETAVYRIGDRGEQDTVLWRKFVRITIGGEDTYVVQFWYRYQRSGSGDWGFVGIDQTHLVRVFDPETWEWSEKGVDVQAALGIILALHDPTPFGFREELDRLRELELATRVEQLQTELRDHRALRTNTD